MELFIDNVHYHVETCGEGFPLMLLHGFTGDSSTWVPFCQKWGSHSQLIMPDIIGHGKTDSPEELQRYTIESAANDLRLLLDELLIDKVDLLGYSMGGRLALTFCLLYPERVRKLILESATAGLATAEDRELRREKDHELANFILQNVISKFVDYWEKIPLFSSMNEAQADVKARIRQQRLRQSPIGLANSLRGMGTGSQPSWWEELERIACEVLFITGEKDAKFCQIAEKMAAQCKFSRHTIVEKSGHAIHVEEPEKFGTIVSGFLTQSK